MEKRTKQSMTETIDLASPFKLPCGAVIPNRFLKSAMSEQLGTRHHDPVPGLARVYERWAKGGVGLNMSGNIMIDRTALGEPKNVVLDDQSDLAAFRNWTRAATTCGSHFWAQLNHPGKQIPSFLAKEPVAPSAVPLGRGLEKAFNTPRALEESEILEIIQRFAAAAALAKEAGFTGVQIHGAHGYLVSQFLSPRHNQREDQWGGCLENRMRFVLEIYRAIRERVGAAFPVGIKLNSADFMKDGFSETDSMAVVDQLAQAGMDLIEISGGTYENPSMMGSLKNQVKESTRNREAYFMDYAEKVRRVATAPLAVTGGFRSARGMQAALDSGATDFVGLARPLVLVPDLPQRVLADPDYTLDLASPTTGIKNLDKSLGIGLVWFEQQIHRMARGKDPKKNLSAWRTVWMQLAGMGATSFKRRRA
ncbi:NADH:flavin oxidoreductase/NADH oxidase family protein [Desulforapulum autotrophicum]|nr:NADH:flavin oxidoreductase/NADH oxidase family protein [Desulforapulum autotrophicum]